MVARPATSCFRLLLWLLSWLGARKSCYCGSSFLLYSPYGIAGDKGSALEAETSQLTNPDPAPGGGYPYIELFGCFLNIEGILDFDYDFYLGHFPTITDMI